MSALRGLTLRGRCFLSSGAACVAAAALLGARDVLRIGIVLLALPLLATLAVARMRYRLACERTVVPARVPVSHPADVTLHLHNVARSPTSVLLLEDQLSYTLGGRPRFILDRVEAGGRREVSYSVRSDVRGRYRIGPLTVRLTDPFGLCELTRSFASTDDLVVTPIVSALPSTGLGGEWAGGGDTQARQVASAGEDDASTREYRHGDDLRKVHWKSTARIGELMVRREEQPWQSRATLLLDTRRHTHYGEGPGSSFEWAISAAASVGVHLGRGGYTLRFVTDAGLDLHTPTPGSVDALLLNELAVMQPSATGSLDRASGALRRGGGEGLIVAVLGLLTPDEAMVIGRLRHSASACIAVLVDTASWGSMDARRRAEAAAALDASATLLREAGWRVLVARHGTTLASLWPQAARRPLPTLSGARP